MKINYMRRLGKINELIGRFSPSIVKAFFYEVKSEFFKIKWPNKKTAIASSGFVIIVIIVLSLYLGAVDLILGHIVNGFLK